MDSRDWKSWKLPTQPVARTQRRLLTGRPLRSNPQQRTRLMADDTPDPQKLIRLARQTLSSSERRKKFRRIDFMDTSFWYPTQLGFFAAGSTGVHQRLIYGGNQVGKT